MYRPRITLAITLAALSAASGCAVSGDAIAPGASAAGAYRLFSSCDELVAVVNEQAESAKQVAVPEMYARVAIEDAVAEAMPSVANDSVSSSTNTQEASVDEGDVFDHDGSRLFTAPGGRLHVIEVASGRILADMPLPLGTQHMVLTDDLLLVATEQYDPVPSVTVSRYAVADQVTLVDRTMLEGAFAALRADADTARVVLEHRFVNQWWAPYYADTQSTDVSRVSYSVADIVPEYASVSATGVPGPTAPALDCTDIGIPGTFAGLTVTWVAAFDLTATASSSVRAETAVLADTAAVYVRPDQLVVATQSYETASRDRSPAATVHVHQFTLDVGGTLRYTASGTVPGRIINRYALRATDEHLMVATTVDATTFATVKASRLAVLATQGAELVEVAVVDGLGVDEDIQSVRYVGDIAYVVTFRTTDPLYVVDLADPLAPVVRGEVKIPGFSRYLHPVGADRLVGIGYDADEQTGQVTAAQMSLFDVADPAQPTRVAVASLGDYSLAIDEPHAIAHAVSSQQLAVPYTNYGSWCDEPTFRPAPDTVVAPPVLDRCGPTTPGEGVRVFGLNGPELVMQHDIDTGSHTPIRVTFAAGRLLVIAPDAVLAFDASTFEPLYETPLG